jgi:hypothetical protein
MRRIVFFLWSLLLCVLGMSALAMGGRGQASTSPASAAYSISLANVPSAPCVYTPVQFSLVGIAVIEDMRPFTTTAGETYIQFVPSPPLTTTATSGGYMLVNGGWSGSVQGGITGSFDGPNLNGLAITGSTLNPEGRGFQANEVFIHGDTGVITALLAVNFSGGSTSPPFYPRTFTGHIHSTATTGSYAPYKLVGTVTGVAGPPNGGIASLTINVQGRLYTGGTANFGLLSSGTRQLPVPRPVAFQPGDIFAQFTHPDIPIDSAAGRVEPVAIFRGQMSTVVTASVSLDHQSLLRNNGTINDSGWLMGNWRVAYQNGDRLEGPWLADLPDVSFHSYLFLVDGTGAHADSLVFARYEGAISYNGGTDIAGGGGGIYCDGMVPAGTPTPVATATSTPTYTPTPTVPPTQPPFPSPTPTIGWFVSIAEAHSLCTYPSTYTDTFTFSTWASSGNWGSSGRYNVYLEAASSAGGPWTVIDQQESPAVTFPVGLSTGSNVFTETNILPQYAWYRMRLQGEYRRSIWQYGSLDAQTDAAPICRTQASPTPPVTATPSSTVIPSPSTTTTPTTTTTPIVCDVQFSDVHQGDYFYESVRYLACHGVISGYADGSFRPYGNTTRGQVCKIVVLAEGWPLDCAPPIHFTDVPESDPFYCYIETLYRHGNVIVGYADGTFRPYNPVTRGQLAKIVSIAEGWPDDCATQHFSDVPPGSPFYCYIETAYSRGIISGYADGTFHPYNSTTRGQISKIVYQAVTGP